MIYVKKMSDLFIVLLKFILIVLIYFFRIIEISIYCDVKGNYGVMIVWSLEEWFFVYIVKN